MTVDGKITTKSYGPVDFTSREDKLHLFRQRGLADAVLIGYGTLKRDNVRLGLPAQLREERIRRGLAPTPLRVIVSNKGEIDHQLRIFETESERAGPIVIFSTHDMPQKVRDRIRTKAKLHLDDKDRVNLAAMLSVLRRDYKVRTVACEGGPKLFRSLLELGLIDQLNLTVAPFLFGGATAPTLTGFDTDFLPASVHCRLENMRVVGDECFLTYRIKQTRK